MADERVGGKSDARSGGGFGFHEGWQNLLDYMNGLDVERLSRQAGIELWPERPPSGRKSRGRPPSPLVREVRFSAHASLPPPCNRTTSTSSGNSVRAMACSRPGRIVHRLFCDWRRRRAVPVSFRSTVLRRRGNQSPRVLKKASLPRKMPASSRIPTPTKLAPAGNFALKAYSG